MERRPPLILIAVAVAYVGYLGWQLLITFSPIVATRLGLSVVLFYFVLRGHRQAGNLLGLLCAISAIILIAGAYSASNANAAIVFTTLAALLSAFSAYLFFSRRVRTFQMTMASDRRASGK